MKSTITRKVGATFLLAGMLVLSGALFVTTEAQASATSPRPENKYQLLEPLPFGGTTGNTTEVSFSEYVKGAYQFTLGAAFVLALIMIIWGGFEYMLTDSIAGKGDGRKKISNAVVGLLLALGSYAILYTINPDIVKFDQRIIPSIE